MGNPAESRSLASNLLHRSPMAAEALGRWIQGGWHPLSPWPHDPSQIGSEKQRAIALSLGQGLGNSRPILPFNLGNQLVQAPAIGPQAGQ